MSSLADKAMSVYYRDILMLACMVLSFQLSTIATVADAGPVYAVVVSDSATPMERRAGALVRKGVGVGGSGLGAREGQRTIPGQTQDRDR